MFKDPVDRETGETSDGREHVSDSIPTYLCQYTCENEYERNIGPYGWGMKSIFWSSRNE